MLKTSKRCLNAVGNGVGGWKKHQHITDTVRARGSIGQASLELRLDQSVMGALRERPVLLGRTDALSVRYVQSGDEPRALDGAMGDVSLEMESLAPRTLLAVVGDVLQPVQRLQETAALSTLPELRRRLIILSLLTSIVENPLTYETRTAAASNKAKRLLYGQPTLIQVRLATQSTE